MQPELHLDQATHTYTFGGKTLPSVTQVIEILQDFSMVPPDVLEAARIFGQHVHEAIHLFNRNELDDDALDLNLVPHLNAWQSFLSESGAVVIASEQPVMHAKLGYAGTPDMVLAWGNRIVIPDIKATAVVPRTVGAQTAAYAEAYQSTHGGKKPERYCIHLTPNKFRAHPRRDSADWSLFLSCLNVWRFKNAA